MLALVLMIELTQVGPWQYSNGTLTLHCPAKTRFVLNVSYGNYCSDHFFQPEEFEDWQSFDSESIDDNQWARKKPMSVPSRIISCFNASATLCAYHPLMLNPFKQLSFPTSWPYQHGGPSHLRCPPDYQSLQ
jgi:hypothetical protein